MIFSEPCEFVGPSHECTAFVTPRIQRSFAIDPVGLYSIAS
ncbi:hypothetical protein SLEP1_g3743 [Rubroshorea leprosula]|uniref:Uncharacterized protein n=1 Tax=Rubroshorea leprosula TaxID=152421 RepID=A0AAV5HUN9_9ROSI|nr:hypothetical protein SLEP1_g3743 [Rubroshorea leprosula]